MALGLTSGGGSGDIKPFVKYDARAGRLFRVDRSQTSGGQWETEEVDITRDATFIADLANIRVGWVNYTTQGPIRRFVILGKEAIPPRPDDKTTEGKPAFKQGFEFTILLSKAFGGAPPREFGSSAGCVIEAVDALHDAYSIAPEAKAGQLPVVKLVNTIGVKSGQSTNYKPIFEIIGWKDRPAELPMPASGTAAQPQASAPPVTGSTQAAPPPAAQAPQPATVGADDFG